MQVDEGKVQSYSTRQGADGSSLRIDHISGDDKALKWLILRLVEASCSGLPEMYREDRHLFVHTLRRSVDGRMIPQGDSARYSAIVLLGAKNLPPAAQAAIFAGEGAYDYCGRLIAMLDDVEDLGDLALCTWAAAELAHPGIHRSVERMLSVYSAQQCFNTVELAWLLTALVTAREQCDVRDGLERTRDRLLGAFSEQAGIFRHVLGARRGTRLRSHVACFADQVYPIQALARYYRAFGHEPSLTVANRCAEQICSLQGDAGQWWWHYDTRNGRVIEGYPVYSVHQDAMGPMALLDLAEAGGSDYAGAVRQGLSWVHLAPEVGNSLIDPARGVIWRKVARTGPRKLVRRMRAAASGVHQGIRLNALEAVFRPTVVEYESRPYHLGWILYTWLGHL